MPPAFSFWCRPLCLLAALTALSSPQLRAQTGATAAPAQLQLSADGSEVLDQRATRRLLLGQGWELEEFAQAVRMGA